MKELFVQFNLLMEFEIQTLFIKKTLELIWHLRVHSLNMRITKTVPCMYSYN